MLRTLQIQLLIDGKWNKKTPYAGRLYQYELSAYAK